VVALRKRGDWTRRLRTRGRKGRQAFMTPMMGSRAVIRAIRAACLV